MKSKRNSPAWVGLISGILLILGATATMRSLLLPTGDSGIALVAVWVLSLVVLIAGLGVAIRDLRWLGREGGAIAAMDHIDAMDRAMNLPASLAETLIVQRAQFIEAVCQDEARAPKDVRVHLRGEALSQTSPVGATPRFLSSVLLLLAVLGTFAGMKTALPQLVESIQGAGPAQTQPGIASQGNTGYAFVQIGEALAPVADAFGANFLALLGSLCLGIVSFGLVAERRQLLGRLERVSETRLYRHIPVGADASSLERAVAEMRASVTNVEGVGKAINQLHGGIRTFQKTLVEAIGSLQSSFSDSIQRQSVEIQSQLTTSIGRVATSLLDVSEILGRTAVAYEGLVTGLEERDLGVQKASIALQESGERAAAGIESAAAALIGTGRQVAAAQEKTATQMEGARASLVQSAASLQNSSAEIAAAFASHTEISRAVPEKLDRLAERETAIRGEIAALNESIRAAVRDAQGAWASRAEISDEAMTIALAQVLGVLDRQVNRIAELQVSAQDVRTSLAEESHALREGLARTERGIIAAISSSSLPREDVLNGIGQVGQGAEGIQRQLLELKDVMRAGFEIYPPRTHAADAAVSAER